MPTLLGQRIRELRKNKGYTLEKLADLTDSSKSYIWELENKAPPRPSVDKISKVAEHLGVTIEYLTGAEEKLETAVDAKFYRDYQKMKPETKVRVREMINLWNDGSD